MPPRIRTRCDFTTSVLTTCPAGLELATWLNIEKQACQGLLETEQEGEKHHFNTSYSRLAGGRHQPAQEGHQSSSQDGALLSTIPFCSSYHAKHLGHRQRLQRGTTSKQHVLNECFHQHWYAYIHVQLGRGDDNRCRLHFTGARKQPRIGARVLPWNKVISSQCF